MEDIKISVLGEYCSGKSRLINDLIGIEILNYSCAPCPHASIKLFPHCGCYLAGFDYTCESKEYHNRYSGMQASATAKKVMIGIPNKGLDNIEILETRFEDITYDELEFVKESKYIIYVLDVNRGHLPIDDYNLLKDLKGIVSIVISKTDTKSVDDCLEIKKRIESSIEGSLIPYGSVFLYSSANENRIQCKPFFETFMERSLLRLPFVDYNLYLKEVREHLRFDLTRLKLEKGLDLKEFISDIVNQHINKLKIKNDYIIEHYNPIINRNAVSKWDEIIDYLNEYETIFELRKDLDEWLQTLGLSYKKVYEIDQTKEKVLNNEKQEENKNHATSQSNDTDENARLQTKYARLSFWVAVIGVMVSIISILIAFLAST